ncbi:dTDP-4-dehydrorhamnose reductase [Paenibacillus selenitireducens]|uniref:dTDP-4-dehydrorhamnose reductase n=1 Tax=Paenibacillus selenitireducens TaxID=1324314 RepID=A0A1T2X885_9BACL|nr:dTDP-4-dehydrorhamnose reductase [Paenibacillus selenitireducens]OPA76074.1 dTDP-4-dehydrorhamnose reductase [Paenibacillus selenitireducens]
MKILVTGANGQLGQDVVRIFTEKGHDVLACSRQDLDITNQLKCESIILAYQPNAIIHCAAYTAVDAAESDEDGAYLVNTVGSRNIAVAAEKVGAKVCYISTDYVFDGNSTVAYREYDNTDPQTVYGKSKRAGEHLVQTLSSKYYIVRTSWVYGAHGNNFVKTMLKLGAEKPSLQVVHDQVGSPTYTVDLAYFLEELIQTEYYGIYHASNIDSCSWYEFAQAIFEEADLKLELLPCTTEQFPRPAPRPSNSVMDHLSIRTNGLRDLRPWREALKEFISEFATK